jgi:hypothetical protein
MVLWPLFLFFASFVAASLMPGWRWLVGFAVGAGAIIAGAVTCNILYPPGERGADGAAFGPFVFGAGVAAGLVYRALKLRLLAAAKPKLSPGRSRGGFVSAQPDRLGEPGKARG